MQMAKKFRYKNISEQEQMIIGVGVVKAGEVIESDTVIENPNFVLVPEKGKRMVGVDPVTPQPEN